MEIEHLVFRHLQDTLDSMPVNHGENGTICTGLTTFFPHIV